MPPAPAAPRWTGERSIAGPYNPILIAMIVSISSFMEVLDSSIANVALANISGGLSASYQEATWVLTSYLIANAIVIPLSAWLGQVIGRKRYYMLSVALFTVSSLLCGLSTSLPMLIVSRIFQGIGGGGLAPVVQSMLADTFPIEKRGQAFGIFGLTIILGPIIGPTLGGWITDNYSWHWIFLINVPVGVLSLLLVHSFVLEPPILIRERLARWAAGIRVDYVGIALIAIGLGFLQVTVDKGQELDWFGSTFIRVSAIIAGAALVASVLWELAQSHPVIDLRLLSRRNFALANLLFAVLGVVLFGTTQFIPELLQEQLGYTATLAGLTMAAGGMATALVMPLAGALSARLSARAMLLFGMVMTAFSLWQMSRLDLDMTFWDASTTRMYQSVGLPFIFVTLNTVAYVGIPGAKSGDAAAILNVVRNLGGGIGISLIQAMLSRREQFHQERLSEHLNALSPGFQPGLAGIAHGLEAGGTHSAASSIALGHAYGSLQGQATIMSFLDIFHALAWFALASCIIILLLRPPRRGGAAPAVH